MTEPLTTARHTSKPPKRSRNRNGCITCKIRRVKCDETRPACNRCASTGRTCDGYPAAGVPSQHSTRRALATAVRQLQVVGPASRVLGKPLPVDDAACFDFFRLCTASMTASVFPGEKFWSLQMLQAAHAEPAVWRAAVALGAFHRRWEYSNYCLNPEVTRRRGPQRNNEDVVLFTDQALKHYAMSLSLAKSINDPNVLAILSVALGAAAHLAGRWTESQVHIRAGLRILREMSTQFRLSDLEGTAQVLERLDAQAMSLSDATSPYEYTATALEESLQMLLRDPRPQEQSIRQNPSTLPGPMDDLGQAALATFRLMRQFFIIADAVTTGAITPQDFEKARLQMKEANGRCEKQLTWLVDMERSKLKSAGGRGSTQPNQRVLVLSLRLYQTTLEILLLAHGSPSGGFPLPAWAANDPDILLVFNTSAIPNRDTPTSNLTTDARSEIGSRRGSATPNHPRYSSSPGLSPMSTSASEKYTPPQVQPKAPIAPTSPSPTLVPSRSPSPYASAVPSPRPTPGPCPRPVQVQPSYHSHPSYSMAPTITAQAQVQSPSQSHSSYNLPPDGISNAQKTFVLRTSSRQSSNNRDADAIPDRTTNTTPPFSHPSPLPKHEPSNKTPSIQSEAKSAAEAEAQVEIPTSETKWDPLHDHFKLIVLLASEIAKNTDSPLPFFMSLEPGLAMPLYFTVKRCRHPVTRRRALGLLRRLNRQEGVWNCALAARAAEEIVILEEGGLLSLSGLGCAREGNGYCWDGRGNAREEVANRDGMGDVEKEFGRLGTSEGGPEDHRRRSQGQNQSASRFQNQSGCRRSDTRDKGLMLPLDIFEKGKDGDKTCEMSRLLEQYRSSALARIRCQGGSKDALDRRPSRFEGEIGAGGKREVDGDTVMGEAAVDGGEFGHDFVEQESRSENARGHTITLWEDGWPNIPQEKRILVQYPIFKMEENKLELLMFVMGDMKDGDDQRRMAKRVVVDLF